MTESKADIKERLNKVFRQVFDDDSIAISEKTTARDIPGWDSLTHIILIIAVEKEFKVRFNAGDITKLQNVGEMIDLIVQRVGP